MSFHSQFNELKMTSDLAIFSVLESYKKRWKLTPPGGTSGIKGSNWFRWWWNYLEQVKVKRLANKTTHCRGSSRMGKTIKWRHMIGQADGDDGMRKPKFIWKNGLIKWQSREVKWEWFHFHRSLKSGNTAWSWFHFYTSLKQRKTMLETSFIFTQAWNGNKICLKCLHTPSMVTQFEVHAPKALFHALA